MTQLKYEERYWFGNPTAETSKRMQKVRSCGTKLEKIMESLLRNQKIKYEKQPSLMGKPDFKVKNTNVLIFCDSSFWHGRRFKEITGEAFKKNRAFWVTKLRENKKRDSRINWALKKEGWRVLRFWDTDILKSPTKVIKRLSREIKENE